jgi:hypothetical protein
MDLVNGNYSLVYQPLMNGYNAEIYVMFTVNLIRMIICDCASEGTHSNVLSQKILVIAAAEITINF